MALTLPCLQESVDISHPTPVFQTLLFLWIHTLFYSSCIILGAWGGTYGTSVGTNVEWYYVLRELLWRTPNLTWAFKSSSIWVDSPSTCSPVVQTQACQGSAWLSDSPGHSLYKYLLIMLCAKYQVTGIWRQFRHRFYPLGGSLLVYSAVETILIN